jgi:hypothetical protein
MTSLNSSSSFLPATVSRLLVKRNGHSLLRSAGIPLRFRERQACEQSAHLSLRFKCSAGPP